NMLNTILNDTKLINILIKEKDLASVRAILKFLSDKYPKFNIMNFRTGKISEDILVSFKVNNEFYPKLLEKFAYNDIPIIMKDKAALEYIEEKKELKIKKLRAQGWSEISVSKKQISINELYKLSQDGKVKDVAKEAKGGVGSNIEIVNKAKELLSETINTAIDNLVNYACEHGKRRQEAIDQLLLIATDKDLKLFHKNEEMTNAGLSAIEVSLADPDYYDNLVMIANNTKLSNLTNIKSAIALSELITNASEDEIPKLPDVVKSINTRWLRIAFETIQQKLDEEEIQHFNNLLNFIEEKRKAA
ncbi:MAG: hypothetical protein KDC88_08160, partial [Ignavibacteriae bacterium]|nr:hypothetical protein [Ignavibacteriota bacterium]